ncbi:ArgE/DapE family deacylase, partial [Candidatus Bathyarchaeota archaeon]|nr:ArgE/DapE family deacylase [Candidatus Bathyarchaeota archaeon]
IAHISCWVDENRENCIDFLQQLIAIPSPSYEEKQIAEFLKDKMTEFGFSTAKTDALGDAMGVIKGRGGGRSFLLNGHIDHVPVGEMVDPYSGKLMDGAEFGDIGEVIYGRAACDMKAAVAAMVLAGRALVEQGIKLKGDCKVAAVSLEEVGGMGTKSTIVDSQFLADVVLIGEATNMELSLGHRGSMKYDVIVHGRSCHASAPERGINALYKALKMITKIKDELAPSLPVHPVYGKASLVITQIEVSPKASNVVPEECKFVIDCRNHPDFTDYHLYEALKKIITELKVDDPEFDATVIPGNIINERKFSGFYTDPKTNPVVAEAVDAITEAYRMPEKKIWTFATDGRIYAHLGIPVIGFGPGEEKYAHTQMDHIRVEDFLDTIKVYAWLACRICGTV